MIMRVPNSKLRRIERQNTLGEGIHVIDVPIRKTSLSTTQLAEQRASSGLHVSIDRPVGLPLPSSKFSNVSQGTTRSTIEVLLTFFTSQVFRTCLTSLITIVTLLVVFKFATHKISSPHAERWSTYVQELTNKTLDFLKGKIRLIRKSFARRDKMNSTGVPMPFEGEDGWGKCTYTSKEPIGKSSYIQYNFELPHPDYFLPLQLGQKLNLCFLDETNRVQISGFHVSSPRTNRGCFHIVAPTKDTDDSLGKASATFLAALEGEIRQGDEIAIKPGENSLQYRGQYLPVTDLVFLVNESGIVPIVDQVKSVLPKSSSSSVKNVSVVWINRDPSSFDLAFPELEEQFYKYSKRLEVSCCVENVNSCNSLSEFKDVESSVPDFSPGTMAVISGPNSFSNLAFQYLRDRQYPADCICTLSV